MRTSVACEHRIARLGRFVRRIGERASNRRRHIEPIASTIARASRQRGRIRHGRTGADHRRIVAGHVRDRDRDNPGRVGALGKPTALDAGQMLAQRVHLGDRRARARAMNASRTAFRRAKYRAPARSNWPMRRRTPAPARDRPARRRPRAQACRAWRRDPASSGTGCPPSTRRTTRVGRAIAWPRDRNARDAVGRQCARVEVVPLGGFRHSAGGLAGREHDQPAGWRWRRQMRRKAAGRVRGCDRGAVQPLQKTALRGGHAPHSTPACRSRRFRARSAVQIIFRRSMPVRALSVTASPLNSTSRHRTPLRLETTLPSHYVPADNIASRVPRRDAP